MAVPKVDGVYGAYNKTAEALHDAGEGIKSGLATVGSGALALGTLSALGVTKGIRGASALPGGPAALASWHLSDDENYTNYRSRLASRMNIDPDNKAELLFVNSMDRLMPGDDSGLRRGYWQDLDGYDEKTNYMRHAYCSSFVSALDLATSPRKIITVPATMFAEKFGLLDPKSSYGDNLDPQAKRASYVAIGLMTGQYLSLMNNTPSKWYQMSGSAKETNDLNQLRQSMYENIKKLTANNDITPQLSPIDAFAINTKSGIANNGLSDYKTNDDDADAQVGLQQAQAAIEQHHQTNFTDTISTQLQLLSDHYTKTLEELNEKISTNQLNDPRVIHMQLHKLRLDLDQLTSRKSSALLANSLDASNQLFETARKLGEGEDISAEPQELKNKAQNLLDGLSSAGELTEKTAGLTGDTIITGGSAPKATPVITINPDDAAPKVTIDWDTLKQKEAQRIEQVVNTQNKDVSNKLKNLSENYHNEVNNSINAASHIIRLEKEQRDWIIQNQSVAESGGPLGAMAGTSIQTLPSVELLKKVIHHGFNEPNNQTGKIDNVKGIQGPAWNIIFTPDDVNDKDSLRGKYSIKFTKQSKVAKQQSIVDQASLISLSSKSIKFTARASKMPRPGNRGNPEYNRKATMEMAMMQAIAVQNTSGLDPKKAKIRISLGYDDKTKKEILSPYMTIERLLKFGSGEYVSEMTAEEKAALSPDELKKAQEKESKTQMDEDKEAQRLGIQMSNYYYPEQPGTFYNSSASELYTTYQKAVEARNISEAGSEFTKQTQTSELDDSAPVTTQKELKGAENRQHIAEKIVHEQAQDTSKKYKDRLDDIKQTASDIDDAAATGGITPPPSTPPSITSR